MATTASLSTIASIEANINTVQQEIVDVKAELQECKQQIHSLRSIDPKHPDLTDLKRKELLLMHRLNGLQLEKNELEKQKTLLLSQPPPSAGIMSLHCALYYVLLYIICSSCVLFIFV